MSRIEPIKNLPDWEWSDQAKQEIAMTGEELVEQSDFVWRLGQAAIAGFNYTSFCNAPWMWFILAKNVTISDLVDFRRMRDRIPQGTLTAVDQDFPLGVRFARFYGFQETGEEREYSGHVYRLMRKV